MQSSLLSPLTCPCPTAVAIITSFELSRCQAADYHCTVILRLKLEQMLAAAESPT